LEFRGFAYRASRKILARKKRLAIELLISETSNNNQSTININQLPKGIYFAEIKTDKGVERKKVVKE
jgi:hypothetical protein